MPINCFACKRELICAVVPANEDDEKELIWECPGGAVIFHDTGNFGSSLYDSFMDGNGCAIAICDDCLREKESLVRKRNTREV